MKNINYIKILFIGIIVNMLEWYDYSIFINLKDNVNKAFLSENTVTGQTLQFFIIFAMGYIARPIGGVIFGMISNQYGRKLSLAIASVIMGVPTIGMGLLPEYDQIGIYASLGIVTFRIIQGLAIGGIVSGTSIFLVESAPNKFRALFGAISMCGIFLGWMMGIFVTDITRYTFTDDLFKAYLWRLPFLLGLISIIIGFYIKVNISETQIYIKSAAKIRTVTLKDNLKYTFHILLSIFINAPGSFLFYFQTVFLIDKFSGYDIISNTDLYFIFTFSAVLTIFFGYIASIIGTRLYYMIIIPLISIVFYTLVPIYIYDSIDNLEYLSIIIIAVCTSAYLSAEPCFQVELYPPYIRGTALGIAYNIAVAIFGGLTPYISKIIELNYDITYISYYLYFCCAIAFIGTFLHKKDSSFN